MTIAQPYYDPVAGLTTPDLVTAAIANGPPPTPPVMTGQAKDMVVACDLSGCVYGFVNGVQAWRRDYPGIQVRALDVFEGLAYVSNGTGIDVLNPKTGYVHAKITVPSAPAQINGIRITRDGGFIWVAVCFATITGSVRLYRMSLQVLTHVTTLNASYPRNAVVAGGWVLFADTYGHKVYGYTTSGAFRVSRDVYFPNTVDTDDAGVSFIICAEHENRVYRWRYPYSGGQTELLTMLFTAPVAPFSDITKTKAQIESGQAATVDTTSTFTPKKSKCAVEFSGVNTLYSQNSARIYNGDLLIADTDNHRVIYVSGGSVVTEVTGFVNPVNAVLF
jgi:hypothetical protein